MPSSPEVWPHESPIAPDELGKGRPEGTPKGTATAVMALNASGGVREGGRSPARVSVSARPPLRPPARAAGTQRAPRQRGDFPSAHTRSPFRGSRGTAGATATWREPERPRTRERGRDAPKLHAALASHSSRPPLPPPDPHYAHKLARCRGGRPREAPTSGAASCSAPSSPHTEGPLNVQGESG